MLARLQKEKWVMYVYISWELMQIHLKHHALFGFANIVHGFLDENTMYFLTSSQNMSKVYTLFSHIFMYCSKTSHQKCQQKKRRSKKSCLASPPEFHFWSRSSPIMGGAVVKNSLGQLTNITLSKIDSVEGKVFAPSSRISQKSFDSVWKCSFCSFPLGCLGKSPRSLLCLTLEESPSGNENGLGFCVPKWWYLPSLWTNNHFAPLKVGPSYPKRKPYRFPTNYLSGAKLFLWVGSFF